MRYKLTSWLGYAEDITVGTIYEFAQDSSWFKDNQQVDRPTCHGTWETTPLCKEVKGVQPSNTFLDKQSDRGRNLIDELQPTGEINSGANGNYYRCTVLSKTTLDDRGSYDAEANDIIETLEMNFAEANAFKAVWRKAAARLGNGKANNNPLYDAQKIRWSGERLISQES